MSFEFFTSHNSYGNNLNDFSSQVGAKQTVAKNKNALNTKKASVQDDSFEKYMNSSKSKTTERQDKTKTSDHNSDKIDSELKAGLDKLASVAGLLTKQSAKTSASSGEALTENSPQLSLELLSNKLQALIDETIANQDNKDAASPTLIQTDSNDSENNENALQNLLKGLIAQILGKDTEQENIKTDEDLTVLLGGLTPQEITDLKAQINAFLTSENRSEDDEAALAGLLGQFYALVQPEKRIEAKADNTAKTIADNTLKTDLQKNASDKTQAQGQNDTAPQAKADRYEGRYDARYDTPKTSDNAQTKQQFDAALKNVDASTTVKNEAQNNNSAQSASQRFLQTTNSAIQSSFGGLDSALAQGTQSTSPANVVQNAMTNVTTQSQSATQSHPATQLVSMTIQKAIKAGDDTNIKLRLDPPDLGRVEVKMSIDKNNAKIVLTAEKPETFMMLQRDADALNRALTDAGIDSGGDLSFELASEDHDFNQPRGGKGSSGNGSGNSAADTDEQIVQSTMDWYVDPDTGRMHYNILA